VTPGPATRDGQPRTALIVALLAVALAGCSRSDDGQTPGSVSTPPTEAATSRPTINPASTTSSAPSTASSTTNGTTIPAGYTGTINTTLTTTMHLNLPGAATIPNAGSGTESLRGTIKVVSGAGRVTGAITLSGLGLSQVGIPSGVNVNSVDDGEFTGTISGTPASPVVEGTLSGELASRDAPVINGSGTATSPVHASLHVTHTSCSSTSGDAVAMFTQFEAPVAQYLSFGGSGAWTATRTRT
jgi:hypothetical protein